MVAMQTDALVKALEQLTQTCDLSGFVLDSRPDLALDEKYPLPRGTLSRHLETGVEAAAGHARHRVSKSFWFGHPESTFDVSDQWRKTTLKRSSRSRAASKN